MRAVLSLALLALAFGSVSTADAQGRRHGRDVRDARVVVDTRPAPTPRVHVRTVRHPYARTAAHVRVERQRRDYEEMVRIARRWRQASANRNPNAKRNLRVRANAWIDREIAEASARPNRGRYIVRLQTLQREFNARPGRRGYYYGYGYGAERRARVLDQLVALSAAELRRAETRVGRHMGYAYSPW